MRNTAFLCPVTSIISRVVYFLDKYILVAQVLLPVWVTINSHLHSIILYICKFHTLKWYFIILYLKTKLLDKRFKFIYHLLATLCMP